MATGEIKLKLTVEAALMGNDDLVVAIAEAHRVSRNSTGDMAKAAIQQYERLLDVQYARAKALSMKEQDNE